MDSIIFYAHKNGVGNIDAQINGGFESIDEVRKIEHLIEDKTGYDKICITGWKLFILPKSENKEDSQNVTQQLKVQILAKTCKNCAINNSCNGDDSIKNYGCWVPKQ